MDLVTSRLVLRRWRTADRAAMAELHADPVVMATLGPTIDRIRSDELIDRWDAAFDADGFGLWCVDRDGSCLGFTGLSRPWFRDGVEIGWRLRADAWGHGYATEAASAVVAHAFGPLGLEEVLSFTAVVNHRSQRVMERIGMHRDPDGDFDHPGVPDGDRLRPHVLFRLSASEYRSRT